MNRRNFLSSLVGGIAVGAAQRTFPFRVFSFPTEVTSGFFPSLAGFEYDEFYPPLYLQGLPYHRVAPNSPAWKNIKRFPYPGMLNTPAFDMSTASARIVRRMLENDLLTMRRHMDALLSTP